MSNSKNSESVKVVVRCRPMTEKEQAAKFKNVVSVDVKLGQIIVKNPRESSASERHKVFTFDSVYDWNSKQIDLYNETFKPLVDSVLHGFNGTIFAYGQTGTGKTYTMEGVRQDPERRGVIPNSFEHIFTHISQSQNQHYLVRASYLEIYQDEIRDLLSQDQSRHLDLRESPGRGICVKNLSSVTTRNVQEIENIMHTGNQNRSVGATNMNEHSSRSHAIFVITVECREVGVDGENRNRVGKLNLVDLAGSERQTKTGDQRERLKEATKINLSLFALGNVISALVDGRSSHIPYRDSKITRLLQDSLGGNARTVMVANIGPASYNVEETLMTLRYSHRAKNIKNKPRINENPKDARIRECQEELAKLKAQLQMCMGKRKRRRRAGEGGDGEEGGEVENNDEDEEGDVEGDYSRGQQETLERKRNLVAEEKAWLLEEKEKKIKDFKREREVRDKLAERLKEIKSKIMSGGGYLMDHTNEQQIMLEQRSHETAEQTRREREMAQQVVNSDEETLEEVDIKTKKLNELCAKLQEVNAKIYDIQEGSSNERQELGLHLYELTKEIQRKQFIIDTFIPEEKKNTLLNRAYFDEKDGQWKLRPILDHWMMTRCLATRRRPNNRGKNENFLKLKLDMPERTTEDYQPPSINPVMAAILKDALWDEEEIVIDASGLDSSSGLTSHASTSNNLDKPESGRPKMGKKSRAPTSQSSSSSSGAGFYPKCRGLVPK